MIPMKNQQTQYSITPILQIVIVFISLFILSCASSTRQVQKQAPETEKKLSDPSRTYEIVSQGVKTLFPELREKQSENAGSYTQRDTVTIKMYINPVGSIDLIGFVDKIDAGEAKPLQNFMFRQVIDSTLTTQTITKVVVHSYLDANKAVTLSENMAVSYIEIRPRDQILMLINFNKSVLGKVYAKRWAENQNLQGTITVRFGVDEHGAVVFCKVIKTTMNDPVMEQQVVDIVKKWNFGPIDNPGDVTEVVYPFTFSLEQLQGSEVLGLRFALLILPFAFCIVKGSKPDQDTRIFFHAYCMYIFPPYYNVTLSPVKTLYPMKHKDRPAKGGLLFHL